MLEFRYTTGGGGVASDGTKTNSELFEEEDSEVVDDLASTSFVRIAGDCCLHFR